MSATEARELLKLPMLLDHFAEHKINRSEISFADFILLHYINLDEHGAEDAHDHTLPFKAHDNCHTVSVLIGGWPASAGYSIRPAVVELEKSVFPTESSPCYTYSGTIWQPPKFV